MNNFVEQQKQKNAMKQNKNILRAAFLLLLVIVSPEVRAQQLITDNGDGTYTIIMPAGDVTVTADVKKLLAHKDIMTKVEAQKWTGDELTFDANSVKVWDGTTQLTESTDYTVTAPTGTLQNTGDYPVTITGAGKYAGEVVAMFSIKGAPITIKNEANEDVKSVDNAYTITTDQRGGATLTLVTPEPTTPDTPPTIETVDIPTPVVVDHVDLDRIFEADKACTLYLPFSIAASKVSGGTFYTFKSVDETQNPWEVTYTEVTGEIEKNTPYIFLPDGTNNGKIVVNNGDDKVSVCTAGAHKTEKGQWEFIGTYEPIKWLSDNERAAEIGKIYGFAAKDKTIGETSYTVGQFVKISSGAYIKPMRAYLKRTTVSASRGLNGESDNTLPSVMTVVLKSRTGNTTVIGAISLDEEAGEWYSLDGRKLSGKPTKKGLYINSGKKVVIK